MRILYERVIEGGVKFIKAAGNSGETPPTAGIATGSQFAVTDTGTIKMYDEEDGEWYDFAVFNNESAGGGGEDPK